MGKKHSKKKASNKKAESNAEEKLNSGVDKAKKSGFLTPFRQQAMFLFIVSFLLFANTIPHEYAVDDTLVITKNKLTQQGFDGIGKIMTTDAFYGFFGEGYKLVAGGRYRPLSIVTFAIEKEFFGNNPHISHFINVLLYSLTVVLLFYLLSLLFKPKIQNIKELNIPFLAALLFAAHPIHTEVVANIKGRDEIMGLLGALGMLTLVWKYVQSQKIHFLIAGILVYVLALLSKENAITFLAVVPLTLFFFSKAKIKDYLITGLPLLIAAGVYVYLRQEFSGVSLGKESSEILNNPFVNATLAERLATVSYTFGQYFKLLIIPHPLTHDYYYNQVPILDWSSPKAIISLLITLAVLLYGLVKIKSKSLFSFSILYFFITISVVSNVLFSVGIAMNERFVYIPSVGFCLLLAGLISGIGHYAVNRSFKIQTVENSKAYKVSGLIVLLILVGYSAKTITRNMDWKNDFTLFAADYKNSPNSAKIKNAYGGELATQAEKIKGTAKEKEYLRKAEKVLTEALEIYPNYMNAHLILGNVKYKLHDDKETAIKLYQRTIQMRPDYYEGNFNLACVLLEDDKPEKAIPYFKTAVKSKPDKMEAWYNLAESYYKLNNGDSAVYYYKKALQLAPQHALIHYKIGVTYGKVMNQLDESIKWLNRAIELKPENTTYYEDLGVAYGFKQEYQKAISVFEKGLKINPENKQLLRNLGVTYQQLGQEKKATEYFQRAGLQ
ncbi:MAG: tetratricopeptide repeat protein [Chitinophagales bacterium]